MTEDSDASTTDRRGFFARLNARLTAGRNWLGSALVGASAFDEDAREELETRLLMSDVGVDTTAWILDRVQSACRSGCDVRDALRAAVTDLLEPLARPLDTRRARPFVILMIGVNGAGKTTTIGKLASKLMADGQQVLLAAADTFRAAAVEQLTEWGRRTGCAVVSQAGGADPAAVVHDALEAARARGVDVVIADTAGRLHTAGGLMDELKKIKRVATRFDADAPHETLLVIDASQGQNALVQAREFHRMLDVTGLVITKLDGSAKGGIVLAIARELALPIRFIGIGEAVEDFAAFNATEFASALIHDSKDGAS